MEKRGIRTDKGEVNRQIAADNKLLKEIKARITRLYNWSKAEAEKRRVSSPAWLTCGRPSKQLKRPDTRTGKIRALQESAALFSFFAGKRHPVHAAAPRKNRRYEHPLL